MNEPVETIRPAATSKAYSTPTFVCYGSVVELTRGLGLSLPFGLGL